MEKLTTKQMIKNILLKSSYQNPEDVTDDMYVRYGKVIKTSNIERRLREMREDGIVVSQLFQNETNNGKHVRFKLAKEK